MMQTSEQVNEIAAALAKAQAEIKSATKDRANDFYGSKYATLDAVMDACRIPLASNGIAVIQGASAEGDHVIVTTMLIHTSGQWVKDALTLLPKDASPQAAGSAITYARRYGLGAMVGVTAEEDDDGNAAQPTTPARKRFVPPQQPVRAPQGGGMPEDPSEPPVEALFPTADEAAERATLIKELKALSAKLKLSDQDKHAMAKEYLGGAAVTVADLSALANLVGTLRPMVKDA
jgi:hypothetical protein